MSTPTRTTTHVGWHEGRDPNAFFSTTIYLAANPDVKAAGVNPLDAFRRSPAGSEGRVPSLALRSGAVSRRQSGRRGGACRSAAAFPRRRRERGAPAGRADRADRRQRLRLRLLPAAQSRRRGGRQSIRSGTSRPSAGRKGAIRTRCSTRRAISRPTPTWRPRASIRSTTTTRVGWQEGRDPSLAFDTDVLSRGQPRRRGRARQSARALPAVRHPRRPLGLRGDGVWG